jgi:hypothetical protein
VQTTLIFNDLSIPKFILGVFGVFEKPVGQFRPNVQYWLSFLFSFLFHFSLSDGVIISHPLMNLSSNYATLAVPSPSAQTQVFL